MASTLETIKASAKDLNSTDPQKKARALEIKRRYEAGLFNTELQAEGAMPVPVKRKANVNFDLAKAMGAMPDAPMSRVPEKVPESKPKEMLNDGKETAVNVYRSIRDTASDIKERVTDPDVSVAQKVTGTLAKTAGGVGDVLGNLLIGVGKAGLSQDAEDSIKGIVSKVGEGVANTEVAKDVMSWYQNLDDVNKRNVDDLVDMGSFIADVVGLKGAKVTFDVAKPIVKKTAEASMPIVKNTVSGTVDTVKKMGNAVTPNTKGISESIVASINKVDPSVSKKFYQSQGKEIGEWLTERGIVGSRDYTVKSLVDNFTAIRNNVDEALDRIPGTYRDKRVTDVAEESLRYAESVRDPIAPRIQELATKANGTGLTVKEINEIKRYFERNIKMSHLQDPTKSSESRTLMTNMDDDVREYLFEVADKNGFSNLRELNKEIQGSKQLMDAIAGKQVGQEPNNLMGLSDWVVLGGGVMNPKMLAGFALKKGLSSESAKGLYARILAGFPKQRPLPRADLDLIEKKAAEYLKKQADMKMEVDKNAMLADALEKAGWKMGPDTKNSFIMESNIPLSPQEQAMIKFAEGRQKQQAIVQMILEARERGMAVGDGFVMQDIDNVPILNPQARFQEPKMQPNIEF